MSLSNPFVRGDFQKMLHFLGTPPLRDHVSVNINVLHVSQQHLISIRVTCPSKPTRWIPRSPSYNCVKFPLQTAILRRKYGVVVLQTLPSSTVCTRCSASAHVHAMRRCVVLRRRIHDIARSRLSHGWLLLPCISDLCCR